MGPVAKLDQSSQQVAAILTLKWPSVPWNAGQ
jgi:hypothetical protein